MGPSDTADTADAAPGRARRWLAGAATPAGLGWGFVGLAFALRLAWVLAVPTKPVGDFSMYIESATYLVEHRHFDAGFIYMPGYVLLLAALYATGGGLVTYKVAGVVLATLGAAAVRGITARLVSPRAAVLATAAYALWPAGIALASVCGTDMPAAVLIATGVWALVGWGPTRPRRAAIAFGLVMGLAASVRAVAAPLALGSVVYWLAVRAPMRQALGRAALAAGLAFLVLVPWGVRNRLRDGEWVFTDSHGGITFLVGANPNSEGTYSRSLNQLFTEVTGLPVLDGPHREADRAAYALAKDWTRFEPVYAAGLVAAKADRLLTRERGLLYWPIYRDGVLPEPWHARFAAIRAELDELADRWWFALVAFGAVGIGVGLARRDGALLALVPLQLCLVAIYGLFFAEPRYRLPVELLLFPQAAAGAAWLAGVGRRLRKALTHTAERLALGRELGAAVVLLVGVFLLWPALMRTGERARLEHRWAVTVCRIAGQETVCKWRRADAGRGASPVRGALDGVALVLPAEAEAGATVSARSPLALPAGRYRIRGNVEPPKTAFPTELRLDLASAGRVLGGATVLTDVATPGAIGPLDVWLDHPGGPVELELRLTLAKGVLGEAPAPVWLSDLRFEP